MQTKRLLLGTLFFLNSIVILAQAVPNFENAAQLSPNAGKSSELSSVPVDAFTGMPRISIPIYNYRGSSNGLNLNVSLDYFAGGIQVAESPTSTGLGWRLNAGGVIVRTVRGMPDDEPQNGFMYSSAIPTDFRFNGTKYYYDSLD